jgi:hypothetical protein
MEYAALHTFSSSSTPDAEHDDDEDRLADALDEGVPGDDGDAASMSLGVRESFGVRPERATCRFGCRRRCGAVRQDRKL